MFIAQELRKKNIAEYLLYMWQVEDTIRAFGCSLPRIRREYIDRFDYSDEQKEEEADWFGNLIRMMNERTGPPADQPCDAADAHRAARPTVGVAEVPVL